jgi:hypothetical protein
VVNSGNSSRAPKIIFVSSFFFLLIIVLTLAIWLALAHLASGPTPPTFVIVRTWLFLVMSLALIFYYKWPLVAVIVGWIDFGLIISGVFPWEENNLTYFLFQFSFDIGFLVFAHLGFLAHIYLKRGRVARPMSRL